MDQPLPATLSKLFSHIDAHKSDYIEALREAVAIKSVSAWPDKRNDIVRMMEWAEKKLKELGSTTELVDIGKQTLPDGKQIPLPPILLGDLGSDPKKKTVLLYGHLDVQPALVEDGWDTEPFELVEKDEKLYGRGSTDDKGPVLGWIHALQGYKAIGEEIPVNIKFCFEGMEESGSEGLDELLWDRKDTFLKGTDYVCISDNYWLGTTKPCITYGLRGICYFNLEVSCASKDLHSGTFGGTVYEAMADLIFLMNTLVDIDGRIKIDGIYDKVAKITDAELESYKTIEFDVDEFRTQVGTSRLAHNEDKTQLLMHRWRYPSLSLHGIEGAFSEPGAKTVIPRTVIGKFSIRIVPDMTPNEVESLVRRHLEKQWVTRGSPNTMKVSMGHGGKPWTENPDHPHYLAGRKATKHVYKVDPDLSREGGSIPVTLTFQEVTGKNVLLLPVGCGDDGAHSQNEKLNVRNYIEGTKLLGAYLYEVSQLQH
ncbi:cytosolic non-specific dipeptidase isoform X1 [Neodiprion fabricii]|uniref:cytosolic non-specific dipeptidase isoform X1 n=1 Tax=Neodiprion fabricii TaxID=2872261 RepID=UPI001ED96584|nr:cytosolic non-specific dipeptidase isoform X1 [Neodiprion fabricii]XP_046413727.1 cytosolic non-specific dipeptidase isoform X1 [Neodiprion fabricii]XP_046413728.1 cytosolic non-specific dipeptidase isoform X1 [Neodiprion fabricii]